MKQFKKKMQQAKFIEAYRKTLGNISSACNACGIGRTTYYRWLKDKTFAKELKTVAEEQKDFVEAKLIKLIDEQNPTAIIFYLKTKGKDRGYVEVVEHKVNEDFGIDVVVRNGK